MIKSIALDARKLCFCCLLLLSFINPPLYRNFVVNKFAHGYSS
nr:MAG TPA: hypothetical protein [Caudoviricetes sp.]